MRFHIFLRAILAAISLIVVQGLHAQEGQARPAVKPLHLAQIHTVSPAASQIEAGKLEMIKKRGIDAQALSEGSVKALVDGKAETVTSANLEAVTKQNRVLLRRVDDKAVPIVMPDAFNSPALRLGYVLTASKAANKSPINLQALVRQGTGLSFDAERHAYYGILSVMLSNPDDPADNDQLATPVAMAITALGASSILPSPLMISHVGRWQEVSLTVPNPQGDSFPVTVSAGSNDPGYGVDIGVLRPQIQLSAASSHVLGWGIGKTDISISASGIPSPEGYLVMLHSDQGGLSASSVELDARGTGTVNLRSSAAPLARVTITNSGVTSSAAEVKFDQPWLFIVLALLGGLAGAFVSEKGRKNSTKALAIGAVSGLIMALAYAVGIDWVTRVFGAPQLAQAGEAVVFVLGALAAIAGVGTLVPKPSSG